MPQNWKCSYTRKYSLQLSEAYVIGKISIFRYNSVKKKLARLLEQQLILSLFITTPNMPGKKYSQYIEAIVFNKIMKIFLKMLKICQNLESSMVV